MTRRWVREKWSEWGAEHPLWQARVLGEFPTQGDNALISLAWLEAASRRPVHDSGGPVHAGLDVAGPGADETVLVVREGGNILHLQSWTSADARGDVVAALAPWRHRLETVNVDSAGIGYYLGKHLDDLDFPVRLVNVGQSASDGEKYANSKGEFYWGLRMRFHAGDVAGLTNARAISQLASLLYAHDARGRVAIERKEDARKRGVKSPDRAEAVMLAFATPALGWNMIDYDANEPTAATSQLRAVLPFDTGAGLVATCGECAHFQSGSGRGRCGLRGFGVAADARACEWYDAP